MVEGLLASRPVKSGCVTAAVSGRPASETDLVQQRPAGHLSDRGQASSGLAVLSLGRDLPAADSSRSGGFRHGA